jgi:hypothetical protein
MFCLRDFLIFISGSENIIVFLLNLVISSVSFDLQSCANRHILCTQFLIEKDAALTCLWSISPDLQNLGNSAYLMHTIPFSVAHTVLIYRNVAAGSLLVRSLQISLFHAEYCPRLGKSQILQAIQRVSV